MSAYNFWTAVLEERSEGCCFSPRLGFGWVGPDVTNVSDQHRVDRLAVESHPLLFKRTLRCGPTAEVVRGCSAVSF